MVFAQRLYQISDLYNLLGVKANRRFIKYKYFGIPNKRLRTILRTALRTALVLQVARKFWSQR